MLLLFDNLIPAPINNYIKYNTYDTALPIKTQAYSNDVPFEKESTQKYEDNECDKTTKTSVTGIWSSSFPSKSVELVFSNEPELCTFDIILTIIKDDNMNKKNDSSINALTKQQLKEILIDEYQSLQENYMYEILQILNSQGKTNMSKLVSSGQLSLSNMIMNSEYYATNLDLWILAVKFNIPLVFLSSTKLIENGLQLLVAHSDNSGSFYFVKTPGVRVNNIPIYKLIVSPDGYKIPLSSIKEKLQEQINELTASDVLIEYIKNFSLTEVNKIKQTKSKLVLVEGPLAKKIGKKIKLKLVSDD